MENPKVKVLKNNCPRCGNTLFAYWLTVDVNQPELGIWQVVCMNAKCRHQFDGKFVSLEALMKRFDIL